MNYTIKEDILKSISYKSDAKSNNLILETKSYKGLLEYQIEMVNNNLHHGVLSIKSVLKDNKLMLFYDVTSKESLKSYLNRVKINKSQLIMVLTDMTKSILDSKELLLDENGFILDEELIFVDLYYFKINLVYIPIKMKGNIYDNFKEFTLNLLNTSIGLDESCQGLFVDRILSYIKQEDFNLLDFLHELNYYEDGGLKDNSQQYVYEVKSQEGNSNIISKEFKSVKKTNPINNEFMKKKIYKPVNVLIAAVSQIIITVSLLLVQDSINSINDDPITTYLGLGLVIVAFDILLLKKLFNKDSMIEKTVANVESNKTDRKLNKKQKISEYNIFKTPSNGNIETSTTDCMSAENDTAILMPESANPTELLKSNLEDMGEAFLKDINNGRITNTQTISSPYTIGRHIEHANYIINNKAVGRTHAEIIMKDDRYCLKDLNSRNGTKINGMRLEAYKEYELKNEDIIIFGDSKHIFTVNDKPRAASQIMDATLSKEEHEC